MASCESCWRAAGGKADIYHQLLMTRQCTPEQQAGDGSRCETCNRYTIHQYAKVCTNCGEGREAG
jgi:hypothetical protein